MPVFVAPMAMQRMAHPDGELAVARACSAVGTSMVPFCHTLKTATIQSTQAVTWSQTHDWQPSHHKWLVSRIRMRSHLLGHCSAL